MSSVKQFSKLGIRQQNRHIKELLASQVKSAQRQATIMNRATRNGPSIIRIVPAKAKKVLPDKRKVKTFAMDRTAKTKKLQEAPSTSSSQVQRLSHKEDHQYESETVEKYEEFEEFEVLDDDIEYLEDIEVKPKQVFVPVQQLSGNFHISISINSSLDPWAFVN